jgi:hypothetical protein
MRILLQWNRIGLIDDAKSNRGEPGMVAKYYLEMIAA